MEALLEKEGNVERWNDDRLDELSQTMKEGFAKSERGMKEGFAQVDKRFEQVDQRFTSLEGEIKEGFERLDDRIFKLMIMMLIFCGGLVTSLLVAVLATGGN
jgi:hypothetical protein